MIRTFLVALDLDEGANPAIFAEEIQESLLDDGFEVKSCRPWGAGDSSELQANPLIPSSALPPTSSPFDQMV